MVIFWANLGSNHMAYDLPENHSQMPLRVRSPSYGHPLSGSSG